LSGEKRKKLRCSLSSTLLLTFVPPDVVELEPRLDDVDGLQAAGLDDAAHGTLRVFLERTRERERENEEGGKEEEN
jgi:hypothetical protein